MSVGEEPKKRKKSKKSKKSKFISFDEEIVSKDRSEKLLSQATKTVTNVNFQGNDNVEDTLVRIKKCKKRKKEKNSVEQSDLQPTDESMLQTTKHKKKRSDTIENDHSDELNSYAPVEGETVDGNIRKKKKRKKQRGSEENEIIEDSNTALKNDTRSSDFRLALEAETENIESSDVNGPKKKKKKAKKENKSEDDGSLENSSQELPSPKKRKRKSPEQVEDTNETAEGEENPSQGKKPESIRQRKRKKHLLLLEEKKLKVELALQQKALNYLSRWKHSRNSWKFEKLRQIWLQQNIFDSTKIPSEFWESLLEYFTGAKGHVRKVLLEKAAKIIEEAQEKRNQETGDDTSELEPVDSCDLLPEDCVDEQLIKLKRARDIMQYLPE